MVDDELIPPGSNLQNVGQNDLEIVIRGDTEVSMRMTLDLTYAAKAKDS